MNMDLVRRLESMVMAGLPVDGTPSEEELRSLIEAVGGVIKAGPDEKTQVSLGSLTQSGHPRFQISARSLRPSGFTGRIHRDMCKGRAQTECGPIQMCFCPGTLLLGPGSPSSHAAERESANRAEQDHGIRVPGVTVMRASSGDNDG